MKTPALKIAISPRPALRVATAATIAVGVVYVIVVLGILTLASARLMHDTDARLSDQLNDARRLSAAALAARGSASGDADDAPVYLWQIAPDGHVQAASTGSPGLPSGLTTGQRRFPTTAFVAGRNFRFAELTISAGTRLFAAESLAQESHVRDVVVTASLLVSPALLAAAFASAFVIGRQASKPAEQARRRQLEFTADASHELRTPLSVIQAEVGLALATTRSAHGYRDALQRIAGESQRLRRIVEDLLWLARFDSEPPPPPAELVDVATIASQCADRFEPIVRSRDIQLDVEVRGDCGTRIAASPEWVDRLIGVLVDNAIRYASTAGKVTIQIEGSPSHVMLAVDDDGPGIPAAERHRLFDRFHRGGGSSGGGAGLGLAIADAVVRSTRGHWTVGDSALGGASMAISWPQARAHSPISSKLAHQ